MFDRDAWSYLEIESFYDRVRALLDNLSISSLPDEYIDYPEKAPMAERYAKVRVPNWRELDEDKFAIFQNAIVYKTASFFEGLASSKSIKRKQLPTITLEYFEKSDFSLEGKSLAEIADKLLAEVKDDDGSNFIGFMVTKPYVC